MDILDLIKTRRSIRKYKDIPIKDEDVIKIIEAGRWAPSASNNQPWRFFVITGKENIKKVGNACKYAFLNTFVENARLLVVIYSDKKHRFVETDCALAAQNMMLEAHSLGIGSCYLGAFREKTVKKILGLKEEKILSIISFGYPEEIPVAPERMPLESIVRSDSDIKNLKSKNKIFPVNLFKSGVLSLFGRFVKGKK